MDINKLIDVLIQVESGGDVDAIGDNGKALGILQIHEAVVQDVNRVFGLNYKHADALYPEKAKKICYAYLSLWGDKYKTDYGSPPSDEVLARIWNGGPKGYEKDSTIPYWHKVLDASILQLEKDGKIERIPPPKMWKFLFTYECHTQDGGFYAGNLSVTTVRLNEAAIKEVQTVAAKRISEKYGVTVPADEVIVSHVCLLED